MTAKDIIIAIETYYNLSSNALAAELNVNHTRIDNLVNGVTKSITKNTADLLLARFPKLNPDFVIKGHRPMHLKTKSTDFSRLTTAEMMTLMMQQYQLSTAEIAHRIGWRTNIISAIRIGQQYKQFTVNRVKDICKAFPDINPNWLLSGYGDMFKNGRIVDPTLPMPAPVRNNKGGTSSEDAPQVKPQQKKQSVDQQAQINSAILKELQALREEINELRNERERTGFAAEDPNKD